MDEKEQADRMAAAEALYMISTRVEKGGPVSKPSRRGRKEKKHDHNSDSSGKKKSYKESDTASNPHNGRGKRGGRGRGGRGGRLARGGSSTSRARDGQRRQLVKDYPCQETDEQNHSRSNIQNNPLHYVVHKSTVSDEDDMSLRPMTDEQTYKTSTSKSKCQVRGVKHKYQSKKSMSRQTHNKLADENDARQISHQAIVGLTGAAISIPGSPARRTSIEASPNLSSLGLVSGLRQVSLTSQPMSSWTPLAGLSSANLTSLTPDVNLPSLPLEIGSLQLSSQPTPNLSSLGDMPDGVMEDEHPTPDREKSEKFLPLKKRKLHNPSHSPGAATPSVTASPFSDAEERPESVSPLPSAEHVRASFTVQASPIITMQTLMEIKTALNADEDGDLPLHIAVVHENMRMVIKLINLMRIAGKGVDKFNKQQQTPLHLAVKLNFLEAIDILVKSGADVNAVDCTGSSSIHMAVQGHSIACLAKLLASCPNADLNARNFDGLTPLHMAVDNGDLKQVEMLLDNHADIDMTDGKSGRSSLFRAAESNQKTMVELLLRKGANPDIPNYAGVTTAMAAQGRNLHGVLKLLGSVPTDKSEVDTKPTGLTLQTKPASLYVGFSPLDKSSSLSSKASNSPQFNTQELTCVLQAKQAIDRGDLSRDRSDQSNNETKVFHNVFVVSQNLSKTAVTSKSVSEPTSPQVKMEVLEEAEDNIQGGSRLLSLPEGILCREEETARKNHKGEKVVSHGGTDVKPVLCKSQVKTNSTNSVSRFAIPDIDHTPISKSKSLLFHIIPSSQPVPVTSTPRKTLTNPSVLALGTMSSNSNTSQFSHTAPASSDSVTLTGMQARLYQKLLEMYNIDPTPANQSPSSEVWREGSAEVKNKLAGQISKGSEQRGAEKHIPSMAFTIPANQESELVRTDEGPLNLSISSQRSANAGTNKEKSSSTVNKFDLDDGRSDSRLHVTPKVEMGMSMTNQQSVTSVQAGQKGKVISIGVRRISENDRPNKGNQLSNDQYEMFLLPAVGTSSSLASGNVTSKDGINVIGLPHRMGISVNASGKPYSCKPPGTVTQMSDFPHITKSASPKGTSIVRDFLSQHSLSSSPSLTSSSLAASCIQTSVPTVLDLAVDVPRSVRDKHIVTLTCSPSNTVTINQSTPALQLQPSSSASPIFLHHGQVIDLSPNSGADVSHTMCNPQRKSVLVSSADVELGQGKIVGLSGAILSLVPAQTEQQGDRRLSRDQDFDLALKEPVKKRGRRSIKSSSSPSPATDTGLNKINSETDEKLKKFLGTKKSDFSSQVGEGEGMAAEETSDNVDCERLGSLLQHKDSTFETVGIFSGDIQHVKIHKRSATSSSLSSSSASTVSFTSPLSTKVSAVTFSDGNDSLSSVTFDVIASNCSVQLSQPIKLGASIPCPAVNMCQPIVITDEGSQARMVSVLNKKGGRRAKVLLRNSEGKSGPETLDQEMQLKSTGRKLRKTPVSKPAPFDSASPSGKKLGQRGTATHKTNDGKTHSSSQNIERQAKKEKPSNYSIHLSDDSRSRVQPAVYQDQELTFLSNTMEDNDDDQPALVIEELGN